MLAVLATVFGAAAASFAPYPARRLGLPVGNRRLWPLVVVSGAAAGLLALAFGPVPALPVVVLAVPLATLLGEIDRRWLRLPDPLVGGLAVVLGLPLTLATGADVVVRAVVAAALVGSSYLVVALLPGRGLGLGDVKLAAVLGYALGFAGWPAVLIGTVAPHLINGPIAVFLLLRRRAGRRVELPLGPAMLIGALCAAVLTA
jgi:leader peptidase (prepilin peptidase)/N-methyltransferase